VVSRFVNAALRAAPVPTVASAMLARRRGLSSGRVEPARTPRGYQGFLGPDGTRYQRKLTDGDRQKRALELAARQAFPDELEDQYDSGLRRVQRQALKPRPWLLGMSPYDVATAFVPGPKGGRGPQPKPKISAATKRWFQDYKQTKMGWGDTLAPDYLIPEVVAKNPDRIDEGIYKDFGDSNLIDHVDLAGKARQGLSDWQRNKRLYGRTLEGESLSNSTQAALAASGGHSPISDIFGSSMRLNSNRQTPEQMFSDIGIAKHRENDWLMNEGAIVANWDQKQNVFVDQATGQGFDMGAHKMRQRIMDRWLQKQGLPTKVQRVDPNMLQEAYGPGPNIENWGALPKRPTRTSAGGVIPPPHAQPILQEMIRQLAGGRGGTQPTGQKAPRPRSRDPFMKHKLEDGHLWAVYDQGRAAREHRDWWLNTQQELPVGFQDFRPDMFGPKFGRDNQSPFDLMKADIGLAGENRAAMMQEILRTLIARLSGGGYLGG